MEKIMLLIRKSVSIMVCLCLLSKAAFSEGRTLVPDTPVSAFQNTPVDLKADILSDIAERSFAILLEVPTKGLRNSKQLLDEIITVRSWLEQTGDPAAQSLSLVLQYGVDSSVLNELQRAERSRVGTDWGDDKSAVDSLDEKLVAVILKANQIQEAHIVQSALAFKTDIGNFCREKGYTADDFLNGRIFKEHRRDLTLGTIRSRRKDPSGREEEFEFSSGKLLLSDIQPEAVIMFAQAIDSQNKLAEVFLPLALGWIQQARDVRLLNEIYWKYGGFMKPDDANNGTSSDAESFLTHVENEIILKQRIPVIDAQKPMQQQVLDVVGQLQKRTNSGRAENYQAGLLVRFRPFLRKIEVVPLEMRVALYNPQTGKHEIGYWLRLTD
jgi:hypothetical protein